MGKKKRKMNSVNLFIFVYFLFAGVQCFKLFEDHRCTSLQRSVKVFDSTSSEEMDSLRKKSSTPEKRSTPSERSLQPFSIQLSPGFGLQRYTQVSSSFLRAKTIWETLLENNPLSDPINIFIDVQRLPSGVLGATENVRIIGNCVEPGGVFPEPLQNKTGISFPDCSRMKFKLPEKISWDGRFTYEKPHMKVLGYSNLDYLFGLSDGQIIFAINYLSRYDFDISDGVSGNQIDFLSVAVHEIGHLLGFGSSLDEIDQGLSGGMVFRPTILDVFRFGMSEDDFVINFETEERYSTPDSSHQIFLSPLSPRVCEFSTGMNHGDGNQASHWKDDSISGEPTVGIMDPTLARGVHIPVSVQDVYAFRSLGFRVNASTPIEILNYELKRFDNYQKLVISAEFVFSQIMFVHYLNEGSEIADYNCNLNELSHLWICPYPRSNLCTFRVSTTVGKVSKKVSLRSQSCSG